MLRVKTGGPKEMHDFYGLMQQDFNKETLPAEIVFLKALFNKQIELLLIADDTIKVTVAYAVVCTRSFYNYGFIWYFAVLPWYRGKGLGTEAMKLIHRRYGKMSGMILEVNESENANNQIDFFMKMGYKPAKGTYLHNDVKSKVLIRNNSGSLDPTSIVVRLLKEIYSHVFTDSTIKKIFDFSGLK